MNKPIRFFLAGLLLLAACSPSGSRLEADISAIRVDPVTVHRYDQALFGIHPDSLPEKLGPLKAEFTFFLGSGPTDTSKIGPLREYLTNYRNLEFYSATERMYPDLGFLEEELAGAFRHLLYYFPEAPIPRVYTYISGGDYSRPIALYDSVLLISIDDYLGADFKPYIADGLPLYRIRRMDRDHLVCDCLRALEAVVRVPVPPGNTLLDHMVEAGKLLCFVDAMIPGYPDRFKIGYSAEQMAWLGKNEPHVWAAIIENQLLYSTKGSVIRTFMSDGPFTADFSSVSPPRLGEYIGWRIAKAWLARNPEESLKGLLAEQDAQKILAGSKYKPGK